MTFAIYKEDTLVGFISMYYDDGDGDFERSSYGVFKMMIDRRYQGRGYGKEAMVKAIEYFRTWPRGRAKMSAMAGIDNRHGVELNRSIGRERTKSSAE